MIAEKLLDQREKQALYVTKSNKPARRAHRNKETETSGRGDLERPTQQEYTCASLKSEGVNNPTCFVASMNCDFIIY
jgi:hypothetical protein